MTAQKPGGRSSPAPLEDKKRNLMIGSLTLIFFCQLVGEIISRLTKLPIPGPVIGMVILFCGLVLRKTMPSELEMVRGKTEGVTSTNNKLLFVDVTPDMCAAKR